jgi:cytidylate kinase
MSQRVPKLITFDGEARSGKGTIVQMTKAYLRDERGYNPMLIDRGQAFRSLVVAAQRASVDIDSPDSIDDFLNNQQNLTYAAEFVKDVYHMDKDERDALLYTNEIGENSAKIGARPASQKFVINLTKKWMTDASEDGFDVVLLDGRALESIAREMQSEGLCEYVLGLYFVCNSEVGARRTLGYATTEYKNLTSNKQDEVNDFVRQIEARNQADMTRQVERLIAPAGATKVYLPSPPEGSDDMYIIDTSMNMTKEEMAMPVAEFVANRLSIDAAR